MDYRGAAVNTSDIKWMQWHFDRNNKEWHYHLFGALITQGVKKRHILAGRTADGGICWIEWHKAMSDPGHQHQHERETERSERRKQQIHGFMLVVHCMAPCIDYVLKGDGLKSLLSITQVSEAFVTGYEIGLLDQKYIQSTALKGFFPSKELQCLRLLKSDTLRPPWKQAYLYKVCFFFFFFQ